MFTSLTQKEIMVSATHITKGKYLGRIEFLGTDVILSMMWKYNFTTTSFPHLWSMTDDINKKIDPMIADN